MDLDKFVIDQDDADAIEGFQYVMHYMAGSVYMSEDIYMGGIDIYSIASDKSNVKIDRYNLRDLNYLLDLTASRDSILMYVLKYTYNGIEYQTEPVLSFVPIKIRPLYKGFIRPCITHQNHRFRGPNESNKHDRPSQEMTDDFRYLDNITDELDINLEENITQMNDTYISLYNTIDRLKYYKKHYLDKQ
jgi:hypothetical protein